MLQYYCDDRARKMLAVFRFRMRDAVLVSVDVAR